MYRAKRKAPAILTEPFDKIIRAFRQKKSLCLISEFSLSDFPAYRVIAIFISGATINGYTYSPEYYTCERYCSPLFSKGIGN